MHRLSFSLALSFGGVALACVSGGDSYQTRRSGRLHVRQASPDLSISIKPISEDVTTIDELKLDALVTNTGNRTLKVLNYNSVLDTTPSASFLVTQNNSTVKFTGLRFSISLDKLNENAFAIIAPGQTVNATHELAALYDFESASEGSFDFQPLNPLMEITDASDDDPQVDNTPGNTRVNTAVAPRFQPLAYVSGSSATVRLSQDLKRRSLKGLDKRAVATCSNAQLEQQIQTGFTEGQALAAMARDYIMANGADALFTTYFGTGSTEFVAENLNTVATESSTKRTMSCEDPLGACSDGVIAYTTTTDTNIFYCPPFFEEVSVNALCTGGATVTSRNVAGGTVLHELTHAVADTNDFGYGVNFDQLLAAQRPNLAVKGVDNYNVFATEVFLAQSCDTGSTETGNPDTSGDLRSSGNGTTSSLLGADSENPYSSSKASSAMKTARASVLAMILTGLAGVLGTSA